MVIRNIYMWARDIIVQSYGSDWLGKGANGTFALVDGMDKTGGKYENAIEDAIIAMNEPKDASVTAIRDYVGRLYSVLRIRDV